jgi:hypothetical protein
MRYLLSILIQDICVEKYAPVSGEKTSALYDDRDEYSYIYFFLLYYSINSSLRTEVCVPDFRGILLGAYILQKN